MDRAVIVDLLQRDNPARTRGILIYVADQLCSWWGARLDVAARGQIGPDGKPNPSVKIMREAAAVLWGKQYQQISKESAVQYLEENHGVEKQNDQAASSREWTQARNDDSLDLHSGGVKAPVDSGVGVVLHDVGSVPRKGRKPGVSKLPPHLRA